MPTPVAMGALIHTTIPTVFITHPEETVGEIKKLHDRQNHLAQEAEDAENNRDKMSNWVCDLRDQRHDVKVDIWRWGQELKSMKELTQLEVRKKESMASGLCHMPVVPSSVSGLSKGTSAEPGAPKRKKKNKPKRFPGLTSQEVQEYYKLHLAQIYYWHCVVLMLVIRLI